MTFCPRDIPVEDAWIVDRLARLVTNRLVVGGSSTRERQGLSRLLFGLQRLPLQTPGLRLLAGRNGSYIEFTDEYFGLTCFTEDGHTEFRLHYFEGSNHCFSWNEHLIEDQKRVATESRVQDLEDVFSDEDALSIEDYSIGDQVDAPPCRVEWAISYES